MRIIATIAITLLWALPALAQPAVEREVATLAARAAALAEQDKWADALVLYEDASARTRDDATRRDLRLNVGVCLMGLGRYLDAVEAFQTFATEGGDTLAVSALLTEARDALATLELDVDPPSAEVLVDGTVRWGTGPHRRILVDPGDHHVEARSDGYESGSGDLSVRSGASGSLRFTLTREARPAAVVVDNHPAPLTDDGGLGSDPIFWVIIAAVVVVVGVGIGVGLYFNSQSQVDSGTTGVVLMGLSESF